jgi:hypothetical protein
MPELAKTNEMSSLFSDSEQALDELKGVCVEPDGSYEVPDERLTSPEAARAIYQTLEDADGPGSKNRALVQGLMDFVPPHDDAELENKGQSDRFNITTGEGPAIKNEAVAAYVDIYTNPKVLADIPLTSDVDPTWAETWSLIMAEEYTTMDRSDDASMPTHLELADIYVTHGVGIGYFDDKESMQYNAAGLDRFKFPRSSGIVSSKIELCCALGTYTLPQLYRKMGAKGWNDNAIMSAMTNTASKKKPDWDNYESIQRDIKANELYVENICDPIEVIHVWVQELSSKKISYYIALRRACQQEYIRGSSKEEFLFRERDYYDSADQAFQIFPFSVGNGGKLYTVRGLGYLIFQLCNAMDIMHCKLLDNARVGSSLIVQPATVEDEQDMTLIDFGAGIAIPPTMKLPERQVGIDLNRAIIPAINESRNILNRATGGLASGSMMLQDDKDRQTKLEISSKLDYINKLNSFAISLFYGPLDKLTREKVRRAFQVPQKDKEAAKRVKEMKDRCIARGVPPEVFGKIDVKRVKASRIIGTGSRASRIMLLDQVSQMFSEMDAIGRKNFVYDYLVELLGVDKANRYLGKPDEKRLPVDHKIAKLENLEMLEGDYVDPDDGEDHMTHLGVHIDELEVALKDVDEGRLDLGQWTIENQQIYRHCVATLEMATVHETLVPELNSYRQRVQQIGELVVNGMKHLNKLAREQGQQGEVDPQAQQEAAKGEQELRHKEEKHQQDMRINAEKAAFQIKADLARLEAGRAASESKMVLAAQESIAKIAAQEAELRAKAAAAKQSGIN